MKSPDFDYEKEIPAGFYDKIHQRKAGIRYCWHDLKFRAVAEVRNEAALVLSLVANVRLPDAPERAFKAGLALLPRVEAQFVAQGGIALDAVAAAFEKLNRLAPLAKPGYIKACTAVAFIDGETNWKAASCLRTICIALDSPLPPQVIAEPDSAAIAA